MTRRALILLAAAGCVAGLLAFVILDWSREDCLASAAKSALTESGFRAMAFICTEKFPDTPTLRPFNGTLDK